jgi:hypothetical protein
VGSNRPDMGLGPSDGARNVILIDLVDNSTDAIDWRAAIINYLRNSSVRTDRNVQRTSFKYVLMNGELYRRTVNDVLLKFLGLDYANISHSQST